jgi:metal-responsive CopG/Arc/MetJ family transcriptional regulator
LKLEKTLAKEIEKAMKEHHYSTKTEFIREAIRKQINELEKNGQEKKALKEKQPRQITIIAQEEANEIVEEITRMNGIN